MQSFLYRLIAGIVVVAALIWFAVYMKSVSRDVRSKTIDDLRAGASQEGMRELPDVNKLREAARNNPGSAEAQAELGKALFRMGDYDEALGALDAAIRLKPADAELFFARAKIRENTGHRKDGIADYEQSVLLDPQRVPAMLRLAELWAYERDPERSIQWCRRVLEIEPGSVAAHRRWAQSLLQKGELSSAINEYEAALRIDPQNEAVLFELGSAYVRNSDFRNARDSFAHACQVNPRNSRACSDAHRLRSAE